MICIKLPCISFLTCPTGNAGSESHNHYSSFEIALASFGIKCTDSRLWVPINYTPPQTSGCQRGAVLSVGIWEKVEQNAEIPTSLETQGVLRNQTPG